MTPEDLAWVATDLLTLAIDEEFPDPDYLAVSFREAVPAGREQMLFDGMARSDAPGHRRGAHPPGRVPPGQAGRQGGAHRRAQSRLAPRLSPANVVIGPAGNAGPGETTYAGKGAPMTTSDGAGTAWPRSSTSWC